MDGWFFIVIIALAIPVCAIAGPLLALQGRSRIRTLETRIIALEREVARRLAPQRNAAAPAAETPRTIAPAAETARSEPSREVARPSGPANPRTPAHPPRSGLSREELIGGRWSVVVGGLALALGGVFLVRYSIEQGWLGPAARVLFGALFAAGLLTLGERMRRSEARAGRPRRPIDIPSVVTSAGATSAFAVVYAAYALYGFIGPATAFLLLGGVAVATLFAAVLHGPILGALGLVGAYAAPLLVSSAEPDVWALLTYLLFPTGAAFSVARIRRWPGLAVAAGIAAFLWGLLALDGLSAGPAPILLYAAVLTGLAALMHSAASLTPPAPAPSPDYVSSGLIALYGLLAAAAPALDGFGAVALVGAAIVLIAQLALGVLAAGLAPAAASAGVSAVLVAFSFDDAALAALSEAPGCPIPASRSGPGASRRSSPSRPRWARSSSRAGPPRPDCAPPSRAGGPAGSPRPPPRRRFC